MPVNIQHLIKVDLMWLFDIYKTKFIHNTVKCTIIFPFSVFKLRIKA